MVKLITDLVYHAQIKSIASYACLERFGYFNP